MKASNLIKTLVLTALLSGSMVAGSASADYGRGEPGYGRFEGHPQQYQPQYQYGARQEHPDFSYYNDRTARYIDQMQAQQRARIQQGIRSGDLTPREAARLMSEQREIERLQRRYMADSRLNPHERQRLMAELDEASRNIWRERHDAQDRSAFRAPRYAYR